MKHQSQWAAESVGLRGFPRAVASLLNAIGEAAGETRKPRFVGETGVLLIRGVRVAVGPAGLEWGRKGAAPRRLSLAAVAKEPEAVLHAILREIPIDAGRGGG